MALYAWGETSQKQLGVVKTDAEESLPQRLPLPRKAFGDAFVANIQDIACGEAHSAAVDALGTMYIWGRTKEGQCGQLGDSIETPSKMSALQHEHIKAVACGSDMTFAITASGALYQFGAIHTPSEALAHADLAGYGRSIETMSQSTQDMLRASMQSYLAGQEEEEVEEEEEEAEAEMANAAHGDEEAVEEMQPAAGAASSVTPPASEPTRSYVSRDGYGRRIGSRRASESSADAQIVGTRRVLQGTPVRVALPRGERAVHVAGGYGFAVVLLAGGGAMTFGLNDRFQCGVMDRRTRVTPTRLAALGRRPLVSVACGQQHAVVADAHGGAWSWGLGSFGQLGHGRRQDEPRPRFIDFFVETEVIGVACGQQHTAFLVRRRPPPNGQSSTAADASKSVVASEAAALPLPDAKARDGAAKAGVDAPFTMLFGCGHAEYGQLGTGDSGAIGVAERDHPTPRHIPLPSNLGGEPASVRCGGLHTVVRTTRGEVLTFGWGAGGALGHGAFAYELEAKRVEALANRDVGLIAAGGRHTLALEDTSSTLAQGFGSSALTRDLGTLLASGTDFDCVLEGGKAGGRRAFLAHRAIIAARCPKLLPMMAFSSSRFCVPPDPSSLTRLNWPSQASAAARLTRDSSEHSSRADDAAAAGRTIQLSSLTSVIGAASYCWVRSVRAPILALLLRWLYTGKIETTERLFLSQLAEAARSLWLPQLEIECDREAIALADADDGAAPKPSRPTRASRWSKERRRGRELPMQPLGVGGESTEGKDEGEGSAKREGHEADATRAADLVVSAADRMPAQLARLLPSGLPSGIASAMSKSTSSASTSSSTSLPSKVHAISGLGLPLNESDLGLDVRLIASDGSLMASRALICARAEYFRTCLNGSLAAAAASSTSISDCARPPSAGASALPVEVDLAPFNVSMAELALIMRFIYTGAVTTSAAAAAASTAHSPRPPPPSAASASAGDETARPPANEHPVHLAARAALSEPVPGDDLKLLDPSVALALMPLASALLMEDLMRLCEVVLVSVCDEGNAAALLEVADDCFAERLKATCEQVLEMAAKPVIISPALIG